MGYSRDPFHMNRKAKQGMKSIDSIFKFGSSVAKAYAREAKAQQRAQARRQAATQRYLLQQERSRARQIRENEAAMRRAERERARVEREREKAAMLRAKKEEQERIEAEMDAIDDDNELWTNVHGYISSIVTRDDIDDAISKCNEEQHNNTKGGLFKTAYPKEAVFMQQAQQEADRKFRLDVVDDAIEAAKKQVAAINFTDEEPTTLSVSLELHETAKQEIKAFWPWKQKRLRDEFVASKLDGLFAERHSAWQQKKDEYEAKLSEANAVLEQKRKEHNDLMQQKREYISNRSSELFNAELSKWTAERDEFYALYRQTMQNVIDGDKYYIVSAINSAFANDEEELPMEYFVDFAYDESNGRVLVDLDLPEIEDVPDKKIVQTASGKRSIRTKSQVNMREDYAKCICGLSMYVASLIFNVSLKIKEVEISGFTQRQGSNTALTTDQYVLLVNYSRSLFERMDFDHLTSIEAINFFQHHIDMTKSFVLKELDLAVAYEKMQSFVPADYDEYISKLPAQEEKLRVNTQPKQSANAYSNDSAFYVDDAPIETFEKASRFLKNLYSFIDRLSKDNGVNKHADNLNGIQINLTAGGFTGDGDTNTYRGKLFFCVLVDLYRSLINMRINTDAYTPASYPLALFVAKVYAHEDIEYSMLNIIEPTYHSFCDMIKPVDSAIPTPGRFFLLGEVLGDYDANKQWYNIYIDILNTHINIVKSSIHGNAIKSRYIDNFVKMLKDKNINIVVN